MNTIGAPGLYDFSMYPLDYAENMGALEINSD